jgi:hypothetical protein
MSPRKLALLLFFLFIVPVVASACGALAPTTAPTSAVPTDAPVIEVPSTRNTPEPLVHTELYATYSPNGKHVAKLMSGDSGVSWDLFVDKKLRARNVSEVQPVWSGDSTSLAMAGENGVCIYRIVGITSDTAQKCASQHTNAVALSFVSGMYGNQVWFVSNGSIYSLSDELNVTPKRLPTKEYTFTDLDVTQNGYYIGGTTDQGEVVVYEASGKLIRVYDCANASWSVDGKFACITQTDSDMGIMFVDVANPGKEYTVNVGELSPEDMVFNAGGTRLAFADKGSIYWMRLSDYLVFYVSDPDSDTAMHPSWNGSHIIYDVCDSNLVCQSMDTVPATANKYQIQK